MLSPRSGFVQPIIQPDRQNAAVLPSAATRGGRLIQTLAYYMLPPGITKSIEHLTSVLIGFVSVAAVGAFVAMLLARSFGGKSSIKRQAIFSVVSFVGLCVAAYCASTILNGG